MVEEIRSVCCNKTIHISITKNENTCLCVRYCNRCSYCNMTEISCNNCEFQDSKYCPEFNLQKEKIPEKKEKYKWFKESNKLLNLKN
ncbi:hypothetical protein DSAG12_04385 [Promethearchaeum syntrophicum]|uniref:Uncharacterized protein n=1 Tax=Promethearchaeum syntrophicum TaxID=2594042 RepID=A0AC61ZU22_9ARCH